MAPLLLWWLLLALVPPARPLHCAFIHGSGHASPIWDMAVIDDYRLYWGMVKEMVQCDTTSFMFANTVDEAWNAPRLAQFACTTALGQRRLSNATSGSAGNVTLAKPLRNAVIKDTVVFSHSMGNLVFAAALRSGYCRLAPSSWWAAASAPWQGAIAADYLQAFCNGSRTWPHQLEELSEILHYCTGNNLSAAYFAMQTYFPGLADLRSIGQKYVSAAMCGTSANGIPSSYSILFELLSRVMHIPGPDDGLISLRSCQAGAPPTAQWGTNFTSLFYLANVNHADATCRNGDSRNSVPSKMPCSWYSSVVHAYKRARAEAAA